MWEIQLRLVSRMLSFFEMLPPPTLSPGLGETQTAPLKTLPPNNQIILDVSKTVVLLI